MPSWLDQDLVGERLRGLALIRVMLGGLGVGSPGGKPQEAFAGVCVEEAIVEEVPACALPLYFET